MLLSSTNIVFQSLIIMIKPMHFWPKEQLWPLWVLTVYLVLCCFLHFCWNKTSELPTHPLDWPNLELITGLQSQTQLQAFIESGCNSQWTVITHLEHCKFRCSLVFWEIFIFLIIKFVSTWWDHFSEGYLVMHFQRTCPVEDFTLHTHIEDNTCRCRSSARSYVLNTQM